MPDSKELITSIIYQCIDVDNVKKKIRFSLFNYKTSITPKLQILVFHVIHKFLEFILRLVYVIAGTWEAVIPIRGQQPCQSFLYIIWLKYLWVQNYFHFKMRKSAHPAEQARTESVPLTKKSAFSPWTWIVMCIPVHHVQAELQRPQRNPSVDLDSSFLCIPGLYLDHTPAPFQAGVAKWPCPTFRNQEVCAAFRMEWLSVPSPSSCWMLHVGISLDHEGIDKGQKHSLDDNHPPAWNTHPEWD